LIYTALGDSITFGESATSAAKAYPQLLVSMLAQHSIHVRCRVLAKPGWKSADLANAVVWSDPIFIKQSNVISVWTGGNDLGLAAVSSLGNQQNLDLKQAFENYYRNMHTILGWIQRHSRARIICCTQYNPFPNSPLAVGAIHQLNQLTKEAGRRYGAWIAPVHEWFEGRQADFIHGYRHGLIEDSLSGSPPIHPNDRGHHFIALGLLPFFSSNLI
jgi:lysophospholipase L1-like esterase